MEEDQSERQCSCFPLFPFLLHPTFCSSPFLLMFSFFVLFRCRLYKQILIVVLCFFLIFIIIIIDLHYIFVFLFLSSFFPHLPQLFPQLLFLTSSTPPLSICFALTRTSDYYSYSNNATTITLKRTNITTTTTITFIHCLKQD